MQYREMVDNRIKNELTKQDKLYKQRLDQRQRDNNSVLNIQ